MSLKELLGDTIVNKNNEKVPVDEALKGKTVGLYFSAHWCPPCRGFTPKLAEAYKNFQSKSKNFEIVFVSSDRDEASFKEYYGEMPWLALDYADRDRKAKLSQKFGVSGIPTLIILDDTGAILNKDGRSAVMEDPEGQNFPWKSKTLPELLGAHPFLAKDGSTKTLADLQQNQAVGLYFSAHWCPPCRGFTPELVKSYNHLKSTGKSFEIVFVSSDRDEASFKEYYGEMPWLALGFEHRDIKNQLSQHFEVEGIPTLVILDGKTLKTITTNGRGAVSSDPQGNDFPWYRKALSPLDAVIDLINEVPTFLLSLDKVDDATADRLIAALAPVAQEYDGKFVAQGTSDKELPLVFMYGKKDQEVLPRIREFANVPDAPAFILNVSGQSKYLLDVPVDKMDSAYFKAVVDQFLNGTLPKVGIKA